MELQGDYSGMDTMSNDFPANATTPGLVETGWIDYGAIGFPGDVDWFRVNLAAGTPYRFIIEASSTNGLFDPQLSLYTADGTELIKATMGQGFQLKYLDFTPSVSGSYYLAATGSENQVGRIYKLYVEKGQTLPDTSTQPTPEPGIKSALDHLAAYGISPAEARDWLLAHVDAPEIIFTTVKQYGVHERYICEIVWNNGQYFEGWTEYAEKVRAFFAQAGLNPEELSEAALSGGASFSSMFQPTAAVEASSMNVEVVGQGPWVADTTI